MALLDAQMPHLITASSRDDWDRARVYGRTALGLLRYHYWMAATSPARMTRLVGVRDQMMVHNLFAVATRGPALIHAHNSHLQREKSTMRMGGMPLEWWSAGALVSAQLGKGYAFVATALGTIRHQGWTRRRRTPSKDSCTRSRRTAASSTPCGWPPPSAIRGPRPAYPLVRLLPA